MARKRSTIAAKDKEQFANSTKKVLTKEVEVEKSVSSEVKEEVEIEKSFKLFVPLIKANTEEQTVTGIVLQPEVTDAQGDIMSAKVIKKAAQDFMADFGTKTKLGFMHKIFTKNFKLLESYIAPQTLIVNSQVIKEGTWLMVVKVVDKKVWKMVKEGKITGFSIGGKAKVKQLKEKECL